MVIKNIITTLRYTDLFNYKPIRGSFLYKAYCEEYDAKISEVFFKKTSNDFAKFVIKTVVAERESQQLPEGLGDFRILGVIPKLPPKNSKLMKELGKEVYHTNTNTGGYLYKFFYFYRYTQQKINAAKYRSKTGWRFVINKKFKQAIIANIHAGKFGNWDKVSSLSEVNPKADFQ